MVTSWLVSCWYTSSMIFRASGGGLEAENPDEKNKTGTGQICQRRHEQESRRKFA